MFLEQEGGHLVEVPRRYIIEVRNGDNWQRLTGEDLARATAEGYPAYAGLDARMKQKEGGM